MSLSQLKCMYCYQAYKSHNYRVPIECSKEICLDCTQLLKNRNGSYCPFCAKYSNIIKTTVRVSSGYCIIHNCRLSHFNKVKNKIICKHCINTQDNSVTLEKKSEELNKKLSKKKSKLEDYLVSLNDKKEKLKSFELILNSENICFATQNTTGDLEDLENKIRIVKESNLIEYNEKFNRFFKDTENISEEYLENKIFKELEDLLDNLQES